MEMGKSRITGLLEGITKLMPFRATSIRYRMVFCFLVLIVPALVALGIISYYSAEGIITNELKQNVSETLVQTINYLDFYFKEADNIVATAQSNKTIRDLLYSVGISEYQKARATTMINDEFTALRYSRRYIASIYMIDRTDNFYTTQNYIDPSLLRPMEWYQTVSRREKRRVIVPTHNQGYYPLTMEPLPKKTITIARQFIDVNGGGYLGVICIDIDYQVIFDGLHNLDNKAGGEVLFVADDEKIAYSKDENRIGSKIGSTYEKAMKSKVGSYIEKINNQNTLVVYCTSDATGWKLIKTVPLSDLKKYAANVKATTIITGSICALLAILLGIGLAFKISDPIMTLRRKMRLVEQGNFDVNMDVPAVDEIGQLSHGFNSMVLEIKGLISKIYEEEKEKRQFELKMLQQQINPHFLYNTLDSINWMARMQNANNISAIITALIKLLRFNVHNGSEFNSIRDEIECLRNYICIQKFRYGDKFDVVYEIQEELLDKYVLKMMLQPLVENSIYHGIDELKEGGWIKISGKLELGHIVLCVEDNGVGMDVGKLEQITDLKRTKGNAFTSIGIANIIQRIKLYYGDSYGLEYESTEGIGTKVILKIPDVNCEGETSL